MTSLGWLSDPFKGLSDLQLGDQKGTLNHQACHDLFQLQNHLFRLGTFWGNCDGVWCPRYDLKWNRVNVGLGILNFWERLKISAPSTLRTLVAIYLSTLELFRITLLGGWCDSGQNLKDHWHKIPPKKMMTLPTVPNMSLEKMMILKVISQRKCIFFGKERNSWILGNVLLGYQANGNWKNMHKFLRWNHVFACYKSAN